MEAITESLKSVTVANDGVQYFELGDFKLQSGIILPAAKIAYKTFGSPDLPAIIYPTWYSGAISDNEWLIGPSLTLNPAKYHLILPSLFGSGQSSSPSNHPLRPWPNITVYDNVRAQHLLVTTHLHITHARAVLGWSMGAGQTYQWATQFPDFMDICVPFCGAAKTALHNQVFLEGVKSALLAAKGLESRGSGVGASGVTTGWTREEREVGLRAFGRGYAGWGFSQAFYRERLFETVLGYKSLEEFMVGFWEGWALKKDPENLLAMLWTWQAADCSAQEPYNGDFHAAMQAIKAKTLVLPGKTDLYFPPEDSEIEVANMRPGIGEMKAFPSIWGHWAGGPGDCKEDVAWLDAELKGVGL